MFSPRTVCRPLVWLSLLCVCGMWNACNLNPGLEPEPPGEDASEDRSGDTPGGVDETKDTRSQDAHPDQAPDVAPDIPVLCGDSALNPGEACDDGNKADGDGCDGLCRIEDGYACAQPGQACVAICGDGVTVAPEACDDSNQADGDGCDAACALEPGYTCLGAPSVCEATCGDGILAGGEVCDDGNTAHDDGCTPFCAIEDRFVCPVVGQPCESVLRIRADLNQTQDVLWPAGAPIGNLDEARCDNEGVINTFFVGDGPTMSAVIIRCDHVNRSRDLFVPMEMGFDPDVVIGDETSAGRSGASCINNLVGKGIRVHVDDTQQVVGFGLFCGRLEVKQGQAVFDPSIGMTPRLRGQTTSALTYDLFCPDGQVPVGLKGLFVGTTAPRIMRRLGLVCAAASLEF